MEENDIDIGSRKGRCLPRTWNRVHPSFEKPVRFDVGLTMYRLVRMNFSNDEGRRICIETCYIEMENAESMPLRSGSLFSKNESCESDSVNLRIHDRFYSLVLRKPRSKLRQ